MQPVDYEVLIVGSGVVGATLACALLQNGIRVALVEAKPQISPSPPLGKEENKDNLKDEGIDKLDLRTFALTRASERIFTNVGVWEKMLAQRLSPFREMHVWDAGGIGEVHFNSAALNEPTLGYIVEQSVIQAALISRLAEFENLTIYRPATVQSFTLTTDETAMQAQLDNGQCLTTRLLIGAEGANSSIRTLAGIRYKLLDHGQQAIVATVQTALPHQETAWQRFLPSGPLAFLPLLDSHTSSIVWSIDTPLAQRLMALEKNAFKQELEQAFAFKLGAVKECGQRAGFPLQSRHVLNYVQPRLALVGDAAHTVLPLAGQGLNLGLLDAAALSEVVLNAQAKNRDFGSYRELRRYERWRKGDNFATLKMMDGFRHLFGARSDLLAYARNVGLNLADTATPLKQIIMQHAMGLKGDLPYLAQYSYP
ncbi:MAG TPA: ubiquinone biosynthesis protein UbiH [Thioploca sp.]|nr:ubiquinone biosynthesis protein UbiH [Thioploca sp.]